MNIEDYMIGGSVIEERKEIFSQKVRAGNRTYFFDVKQSKEKTQYLVISESKSKGTKFEHHRVMIFEEDIDAFIAGFEKTVDFIREGQKPKSYSVEKFRQQFPKAYTKWTADDDMILRSKYDEGISIAELSIILQRKPGAIRSRLVKLGINQTA